MMFSSLVHKTMSVLETLRIANNACQLGASNFRPSIQESPGIENGTETEGVNPARPEIAAQAKLFALKTMDQPVKRRKEVNL